MERTHKHANMLIMIGWMVMMMMKAYLMTANNWTFAEAKHLVRTRRPQVSSKYEEQLRLWEGMRYQLEGDTPSHSAARSKGYLTRHPKNRGIALISRPSPPSAAIEKPDRDDSA